MERILAERRTTQAGTFAAESLREARRNRLTVKLWFPKSDLLSDALTTLALSQNPRPAAYHSLRTIPDITIAAFSKKTSAARGNLIVRINEQLSRGGRALRQHD